MHPQGSHTWPGESKAGYEYKVVLLTPAYATVQWEERGQESYTGHATLTPAYVTVQWEERGQESYTGHATLHQHTQLFSGRKEDRRATQGMLTKKNNFVISFISPKARKKERNDVKTVTPKKLLAVFQ